MAKTIPILLFVFLLMPVSSQALQVAENKQRALERERAKKIQPKENKSKQNTRKPKATKIKVARLDLGKHTANCYVVHANNNDGYVIDPGGNFPKIIEYLKKHKIRVIGYLVTHAHSDHFSAIPKLSKVLPAPVGIHKLDAPHYKKSMGSSIQFKPLFNKKQDYGSDMLSFSTIHTPGHSPGSVCIYFKKAGLLFTGDTLFAKSVGRTDLFGGSNAAITASLKKLNSLPAKTKVFPGYGSSTTIKSVRQNNPFMKRLPKDD